MHAKPIQTCIILALIAAGLLGVGIRRGTQAAGNAHLEGVVRDESTGAPIAGATIRLPDLGLSAVSGGDGHFSVQDIAIPQEFIVTNVVVSAEGYGDWRIEGVRLVQVDTLILTAELGLSPKTIQVPPPRLERPLEEQPLIAGALGDPTAEDQTNEPLPATIDVRITGYAYCDLDREYTVETIDFKEYVKHVLPNEWSASWPGESLRSGAMAAKMYAWSIVAAGGKWNDADVYDSTCDQVYNPSIEYQSTNDAVDFTWNWRQTWSSDGSLVRAYYRAYYYMCEGAGLSNRCMGQWDSREMAYDRYSWDEILAEFYVGSQLNEVWDPPGGYSLRYEGNGYGDLDRVKIRLDGPARPVDVGTSDFTIEWWMKANSGENGNTSCTTAADAWRGGNILIDRDIFGPGDHGEYGISLMNERLAFGVHNGSQGVTACGTTNLADGGWHHVAVQRTFSDGELAIYVDGTLDGSIDGPTGDITYRDGRTPLSSCGSSGDQPCSRDPYLVLGAEKHDQDDDLYPSFLGWIDELRVSDILRYGESFATPSAPFSPDGNTMALYHFDRGFGNDIGDSSGAAGGPSDGFRRYGGVINGPEWTYDSPWYVPPPTPTPTPTSSPTATAEPTNTPTPTNTASPTPTPTDTPSPTPTPSITPTPTPTPIFGDVPPDHWASDYIEALYDAGFVAGCSSEPRNYCPDRILDRAEAAVFVERGIHDLSFFPADPSFQRFDDLPLSSWAAKWAEALFQDGYTAGCSTDPLAYCPWQENTRTEASVFFLHMVHGSEWTPPDPVGLFTDVDLDWWGAKWAEAAYNEGLIPACSTEPLQFCPNDPLDRAWAAYMMVQAKGGLPLE